jgi:hypothetical protein
MAEIALTLVLLTYFIKSFPLALATIQAKAKNFACNQRFLLCLI